MRENAVESQIVKETRRRGGVAWKWVSPGRNGVPDRICIFPGGQIIFVELKRPGRLNGQSRVQKVVAELLEALGCEVWLIDNVAEFRRRLEELNAV